MMNKKGVALILVLGILLVVAILANIILNSTLSQSSLTNYQVKRMQAYYAAQAGVNYAFEQLRLNDANWTTSPTETKNRRICGGAYNATNPTSCSTPNLIESSFPAILNYINITIGPLESSNRRSVNVTASWAN